MGEEASLRKCSNCDFRDCEKQDIKSLVTNRLVVGKGDDFATRAVPSPTWGAKIRNPSKMGFLF